MIVDADTLKKSLLVSHIFRTRSVLHIFSSYSFQTLLDESHLYLVYFVLNLSISKRYEIIYLAIETFIVGPEEPSEIVPVLFELIKIGNLQ